jgi:hypothetical protein
MKQPLLYAILMAWAAAILSWPAAAEELSGREIKALIEGKTAYLETTAASGTHTPGKGAIYYAADGSALYKTPMGLIWHATWYIKNDSACHDWREAPNNPCTKFDRQGDKVNMVNVATGRIRAVIVKFAAGNAEQLTP